MPDKSPAIALLRWIGRLLPGDYLRTSFYLYGIAWPRRCMRTALNGFYRMEHVYDVLREARKLYRGRFTILEFGTNEGYALHKILYATRYLRMEHRVTVHGFDSFEGMPSSCDRRDWNVITDGKEWIEGQFRGEVAALDAFLSSRYSNYYLHKGLFEETLSEDFLKNLDQEPPLLVWIDCDYYTSTRAVMERIVAHLPNGCVVYFDEIEFNYGSVFTGEARVVHELNHGEFGDGIELVLDTALSLDTKRVYRFVRFEGGIHYERAVPPAFDAGRALADGSPLP
jgi:hypothetical protein